MKTDAVQNSPSVRAFYRDRDDRLSSLRPELLEIVFLFNVSASNPSAQSTLDRHCNGMRISQPCRDPLYHPPVKSRRFYEVVLSSATISPVTVSRGLHAGTSPTSLSAMRVLPHLPSRTKDVHLVTEYDQPTPSCALASAVFGTALPVTLRVVLNLVQCVPNVVPHIPTRDTLD